MTSFHPPLRTLMGPGPSDVHPRVLAAMARPTVGHLDPSFSKLMDSIKDLLRFAFKTGYAMTFPVSGPGSSGMEACFVNLVAPGDTVVVGVNGVFGGRMAEAVRRCGGTPVIVEQPWGAPVSPDRVREALDAHPEAKTLAFVHAETSTGARSDAALLCSLARERGLLSIVDTVTSLGGIPVEVEAWGADAVFSGTQKCLSCAPGLSPVTFSDRAVERVRSRPTPPQSWLLDVGAVAAYWSGEGGRTYHHTAPVNALYGLHESLLMLQEEGLEAAWQRHATQHAALVAGLEAMGLSLLVEPADRLPQLNTVRVPEGVDEAFVRRTLLARFGLEIGAGIGPLAGQIWRIGLMGQSASPRHVLLCLQSLEHVLNMAGASIQAGRAAAAAEAVLARTA